MESRVSCSCTRNVHRPPVYPVFSFKNGNRTEWNPIRSVTILVINKIGRLRSGYPICLSRLWLQTELDDTKSFYQLIKTMKILRKKLDYGCTFWQKKKKQLTRQNARQQRPHTTGSVPSHGHHVFTVPLNCPIHCPVTSMTRTLSY